MPAVHIKEWKKNLDHIYTRIEWSYGLNILSTTCMHMADKASAETATATRITLLQLPGF